jgi:hypothetical protein
MLRLESNSIFLETRVGFSDFGFFGFFKLWNKRSVAIVPKTGNGLFIIYLGNPGKARLGPLKGPLGRPARFSPIADASYRVRAPALLAAC